MDRDERNKSSPQSTIRRHSSREDSSKRYYKRESRRNRSSSDSLSLSDHDRDGVGSSRYRRSPSSSSSSRSYRKRLYRRRSSSTSSSYRNSYYRRRRRSPKRGLSSRYDNEASFDNRRSSNEYRRKDSSDRTYSPSLSRRRQRYNYNAGGSPPVSSRSRRYERGHSSYRSKWFGKTNTIMVRELPTFLNEAEIREDLMTLGFTITDMRLVRRKDTGVSRGFGFIDLISAEEAEKFLEHTKGQYKLLNEHMVTFLPSPPRWDADDPRYHRPIIDVTRDWECIRCGIRNFKRREFCFKCNLSKEDSDKGRELEGSEAISAIPCNTLVLRGLHPDGIERERLLDIIEDNIMQLNIKPLEGLVIKSQYEHEHKYRQRNSFAFIEFSTIHEATIAMEKLKTSKPSCLFIDGYEIFVDFARAAFVICADEYTGVNKGESFRLSATTGSCFIPGGSYHNSLNMTQPLSNSASIDNPALPNKSSAYTSVTDHNYNMDPSAHSNSNNDKTSRDLYNTDLSTRRSQCEQANVGAAVAQAALQSLHAFKHRTVGDYLSTDSRDKKIRQSATDGVHSCANLSSATSDRYGDNICGSSCETSTNYPLSSTNAMTSDLIDTRLTNQRSAIVDSNQQQSGSVQCMNANPNGVAMYWDGSRWFYVSAVDMTASLTTPSGSVSASSDQSMNAAIGSVPITTVATPLGNTPIVYATKSEISTDCQSKSQQQQQPYMQTPVIINPVLSHQHAASIVHLQLNQNQQQLQTATKIKQPPVNSAKRIAKEMEKWASSQNKQKAAATPSKRITSIFQHSSMPAAASALSAQRQQQQQILLQKQQLLNQSNVFTTEKSSSTALGIGFGVNNSDSAVLNSPLLLARSASLAPSSIATGVKPLVADAYGTGDNSDDEQKSSNIGNALPLAQASSNLRTAPVETLIDWVKLTCLLCKRKFNSREILEKHIEMSTLHRDNVKKYNISLGKPNSTHTNQKQIENLNAEQRYRDRAKERREMYSSVGK
ncbi:hypothetical protein GJ496_011369 [Pomphorhynchus laevis]|nr:hypothetical protein GJ496_011369 [Pomphorhynchus laevis]